MNRAFPRLSFAFFVVLLLVTLASLVRYAFFILFGDAGQTSGDILLKAFYIGFKLDLRLALLVVLPFLALAWIPGLNPGRSPRAGVFWSAHFAAVIGLIMLIYLLDLGHYDYLEQRLNASALEFLRNPIISTQMMWQTYPILPGLVLLIALGVAVFFTLRWVSSRGRPAARLHVALRAPVIVVAFVFFVGGIYGKLSYYPLRWSDAYFSDQQFPSHLALNPALYFVNTFATIEADVSDLQRLTRHYGQMATYLGVERPNAATLDFSRHVRPTPLTAGRPNIVVIMMESFAAHLTGFYGNPLHVSPEFDHIAENGLVFTRFYTPSVGTARGVFTLFTGIPDVSVNRTASRNPRAVEQHIILNDLKDYRKFYFLGGSANWANIRALLQHNVNDLELYEEGSFPNSPRTDVWGISDLHLFEEANRVLRDVEGPFFAFIHLAGNHRPYTIPQDNRGFSPVAIDDDLALANGFDKVDGFNSFRFMDHSLGFYRKIAEQEKYFDNTLFILTADNGELGEVPGPLHSEEVLGISYHHAPFVIFGPPLQRRGERTAIIGTQMDLMPTIAGALGVPALNTTLGRNLLDPAQEHGYAFIHRRWGIGSDILVLDDEFLLSQKEGTALPALYALKSQDPTRNLFAEDPARAETMRTLAEAFFETSKYMAFGVQR